MVVIHANSRSLIPRSGFGELFSRSLEAMDCEWSILLEAEVVGEMIFVGCWQLTRDKG